MADYTARFNTELSHSEEQAFQSFLKSYKDSNGRDLSRDLANYDVRGWWKAGGATAENGHGPDTYKKPNHPTFSDESKYHGVDGHEGGKWAETEGGGYTFTPGRTNMENYSPKDLQEYFNEREGKDVKLVLPNDAATVLFPTMPSKRDD